ncbi:Alpha/Beta hydrolase protein [Pyronema domesticum]|uniref:Carboxylic ester hydrolase n=1 Tax=Pyronema omphalodes (strain CBS 100304) TaxID=1076935 RepID=U4L0A5_PYROM|nr:Alpha/Beta hydrolase protein [Pyronema domesticum]CCX05424.1 Similar to Lipase 3; acc. no. Q96VC9 [Pyronema omphalodes CBS 100304]
MPFHHASLNATVKPVSISSSPGILQYRNIKFASIPERLQHSQLINDWNGAEIGSDKHGPRCPQLHYDLNTLFRIPAEHLPNWKVDEDEFECLNLEITVPEGVKPGDNVPVMIWVHGGSLVATVGCAETKVCDPVKLVASSVEVGSPIIYVAINYRLNFLGFTYISEDLSNFGLFDQKKAIEWIHKHISGFGGDPNNLTLAGESAGAIATNFHTISNHSHLIKQVILQSGTATTIPPQPTAVGDFFRGKLFAQLVVSNVDDFRKLPVEEILAAQAAIGVHTLFPIATGTFWAPKTAPAWPGAVLIGDCEREHSLFTTGITSVSEPRSLFPQLPQSETILAAYGDDHMGILRFAGDAKFNYFTEMYARDFAKSSGGKAYRYIFDAANPFVPEAGAHHAVDLLYLFGGIPLPVEQEEVGAEMRSRWVKFVNGSAPFDSEKVLVFTSVKAEVMDKAEISKRRNVEQWKVLEELGWEKVAPVVGDVVRGRIKFE